MQEQGKSQAKHQLQPDRAQPKTQGLESVLPEATVLNQALPLRQTHRLGA